MAGERLARGERFLAYQLAQIGPLHLFHGEIEPRPGTTTIVDSDDARVLQRGQDPCFAPEALLEVALLGDFRSEQLERDGSCQFLLLRRVNDAHATLSQQLTDGIARKECCQLLP